MEKKWNLQDIQPATPRKKRVAPETRPQEPAPEQRVIDEENDGTMRVLVENGTEKKRSHLIIAISIFFLIITAGFLASFLLAGAEITVYPRNKEPNINATFETFRTPQVEELSYEIMSLEADGERQVKASGQEEVLEQATGELVIYKTSSGAERLIKNTRFQSPDGLVYRITESVVVPGATKNGEGELVPGSIRAQAFADAPGEKYNIGASKFTVPGYQEGGYDDLFASVYAQNPSAFVGGFEGVKFIIDDGELETEKQALQMELRDALLARVATERPSGFVLYDEAITFTYQSLPAVEYGDNLATIKEKALLQVPMFKDEDFASHLASASIPGYEGEPVRIDNIQDVKFSYSTASTTYSDIGNVDSLSFKLVGKPHIIWTYDEGRLKADLLNASKTALTAILGAYPSIERAKAVVRPFWKRSFPSDMEEITIIEVLEDAPSE